MTVAQVYMSGNVRRYHANPVMGRLGQTNADHQGRCVQLLLALHPGPSVALIWAVAHHDVGERWAGDLPKPFKERQPELAAEHAEIEANFAESSMGWRMFDDLSREDLRWLQLVDKLEAYAFMATHAPEERHDHGWPEDRKACVAKAWALGAECGGQVQAFLDALDRRDW